MGRPTVEPRQGIVVASADDIARAIIMVLDRPEVKKIVGETLAQVVWGLNWVRSTEGDQRAQMPKKTAEKPPQLMDAFDLAARLQISHHSVHRLKVDQKLPREIRLGGCVRWDPAVIERWIAAGSPDRKTWEAGNAKEHVGQGRQTRRRTREHLSK
jgi:predicted DNA-binding transcriptional regulator AlpA